MVGRGSESESGYTGRETEVDTWNVVGRGRECPLAGSALTVFVGASGEGRAGMLSYWYVRLLSARVLTV